MKLIILLILIAISCTLPKENLLKQIRPQFLDESIEEYLQFFYQENDDSLKLIIYRSEYHGITVAISDGIDDTSATILDWKQVLELKAQRDKLKRQK